MKKLVVFFLIMLSIVLGACNPNPTNVPTKESTNTPTNVPTKEPTNTQTNVPTIEPTATPEEFVWSCENDPVKNIVLDLGIYGTFKTECDNWTEWHSHYGVVTENRYKMPLSYWRSEVPVSPPPAKKGDTLSFTMPATGFIEFLSSRGTVCGKKDANGECVEGLYSYELVQYLKIMVDGVEYQVIGTGYLPMIGKDKEYIIPKGAKVELIALEDGLGGNQPLNGILGYIFFIRTLPNEMPHRYLNNDTKIDMGMYGIFRPLFNSNSNRWYFEFSEETIVEMGIWENKPYHMPNSNNPLERLGDFLYWEEATIMFVMPSDGAVFYDTKFFSPYQHFGFAEKSCQAMEIFTKDSLVIMYVGSFATLDGFYIDFFD